MTHKEQLIYSLSLIEEAFEQHERMFDEFIEIAPEGITIIDAVSLQFLKCNLNGQRLVKYPMEQLLQMTPLDISPAFQPCGMASETKSRMLIERALKNETVVFEWMIVDGEGQDLLAECRLAPLKNGDQPQIYASFNDITARKKTEAKIARQNRQLRELAALQSHQVRQPVAQVLGLISLFDFTDPANPMNREVLLKLQSTVVNFDRTIHEITGKVTQLLKE